MKKVPISFDKNLLETVDRFAVSTKTSRSAMGREALKHWIREKEIKEFEDLWIRSIKDNPDDPKAAEAWIEAQHWSEP
jgi:metal-responsive CopG/Arc/MetJ family transcriptional regulator